MASALAPDPKVAQRTLVDRAFLLLTALVAISTAGLPSVTGYGTQLFQVIALGAWLLIERVTSGVYAAEHHTAVWVVALFVNVLVFWLIAGPLWVVTRRRQPLLGLAGLVGFTAFYIGSLFWLFPATDGP